MRLYCYATALVALGLITHIAQAQTLPATEPAALVVTSSAPKPTWLPHTLFKVGTGLSRQSEYGGYSGLALPVILGAEHQLNQKFSVYGEVAPVMRILRSYNSDNRLTLARLTADVGGRYYYNQAKRERLNRAHGPFVGNYLSLRSGADCITYKDQISPSESRRQYRYVYSNLTALWGMQRRIGQWGVFDGGAGLGFYMGASNRYYYDNITDMLIELNARISLAH